ncbi:hypothetical protein DL765_001333 [Monosporascus sp. GIB2]|nr:hypothetical protein DL765_001333 [Monosporascus sp. GIB2]
MRGSHGNGRTHNPAPCQTWFEPPECQGGLIQRRWHYPPLQDPLPPNLTYNDNDEAHPGSCHAPVKASRTATGALRQRLHLGRLDPRFLLRPEDEDCKCPEAESCDFRCMYRFWYHALGPALAYMVGYGRGLRAGGGPGLPVVIQSRRRGSAPGPRLRRPVRLLRDHPPELEERQLPDPPRDRRDRALAAAVLPGMRDGTAASGEEYLVKFPGTCSREGTAQNNTVPGPRVWRG